MIKVYNSLNRKKELLKPIEPNKIKIYVCGPTVYDFCHIGNARTYAAFDVIIRYLKWRGYEVTYVRNITDIDDKIIKRAEENNVSFQEIVDQFTQAMHDDFAALGLLKPDHEPRATEYVKPIISFIERLIKKEAAYIGTNGDVYYNVRQFPTYGCLAHRNIDQLESGARVEINDIKRDPLDFVLWKLAKPGEPFWESPWGIGRPGWHIECSAMSTSLLTDHFDMHGGGKDLIFPHHENEIAQTEAATGTKFVNVWLHAGYLQIEKEKMSKSLGNFFTIREILQEISAEVLRYFLITSHYRSPINFSKKAMMQARNALRRFYTTLKELPEAEKALNTRYETAFREAMDDDFNTPVAFSVLFELSHEIQRVRSTDLTLAAELGALLKYLGGIFGILQDNPINFLQGNKEEINSEEVEELIRLRNVARSEKNWAEADRIRTVLQKMAIALEDGESGTTWSMIDQTNFGE